MFFVYAMYADVAVLYRCTFKGDLVEETAVRGDDATIITASPVR